VSANLSGGTLPVVPELGIFNTTEYSSPERRFILGAVSYYEGPKVWVYEISPYDTASAEMIELAYNKIKENAFFGEELYFHPSSVSVAAEAKKLSAAVKIITNEEIYKGIDYQPLTLATGVGQLRFAKAKDLETLNLSFTEIVVLDEAPNDISVVQGLITEAFQTPLSHINVLSQNRKTPNMGLRNAMTNEKLRALEGKLVELKVDSNQWSIREVTQKEAEEFWAAHKPEAVTLPALDLTVTNILDIKDVTPEPATGESLRASIKKATNAFGGKAAQYSILARTENVPVKPAFAIPVYYYDQFMKENGFYDRIDTFLKDNSFNTDTKVREDVLTKLREDMMTAPLNQEFQDMLKAKIAKDFPDAPKMRFRTSTNSEDLEGFPCAGCYESHTGTVAEWDDVLEAIKESYASSWLFRTFEERTYYSVDHKSVGMALLVHTNFPDEEANGVAVTANPFDDSGLDPAFYVNVQFGGDVEVVAPPAGVTSDQFLYYYSQPNQPTVYISHSSLISDGSTVLSAKQIFELGKALDAIHERFSAAYGPGAGNNGWYAMDVEFKFDDDGTGETPKLYIKQARPYPGRGE